LWVLPVLPAAGRFCFRLPRSAVRDSGSDRSRHSQGLAHHHERDRGRVLDAHRIERPAGWVGVRERRSEASSL